MKRIPFNIDSLPAPDGGFPRAMELEIGGMRILVISGTSSVGPDCQTMYPGDFEAQARHTYKNIEDILKHRNFEIKDVISWRIFLKDINAHYARFNKIRDEYFRNKGIKIEEMVPSTCVEAKLCREDLSIEIEAIAIKEKDV